jgi:hypothetical protein
MKVPHVPLDVWAELYKAAERFYEYAPWEIFEDSDLFAIENPLTKEMGYGCIMGAMGQVLALAVFRGDEGLNFHQRLYAEPGSFEDIDEIFASQNALMVEFVDRRDLAPKDRTVIKALGRKYRGAKAYPQFRSTTVGCPPWFITEDEAKFLTFALFCACDFTERFARNPGLLDEGGAEEFFTYGLVHKNGKAILTPKWRKYRPEPIKPIAEPVVDEMRLKKIQKMNLQKDLSWELDLFYLSGGTILDRDKPYYGKMVMAADSSSYFLLDLKLIPPGDDPMEVIQDTFITAIERHGHIPQKVLIKGDKDIVGQSIKTVCGTLGLELEIVDSLPAIREAKDELSAHMEQGLV